MIRTPVEFKVVGPGRPLVAGHSSPDTPLLARSDPGPSPSKDFHVFFCLVEIPTASGACQRPARPSSHRARSARNLLAAPPSPPLYWTCPQSHPRRSPALPWSLEPP